MRTEILYEDGDILVVYKPAGLAAQTARVGQQDVVSELRNYLCQAKKRSGMGAGQQQAYLGVIHRLDQPVEGLLVFAKNKKAAAALAGQLSGQGGEGTFGKHYYAVLCGLPVEEEGELTDYLAKSKENRAVIVELSLVSQGQSEARKAVLRYHILRKKEAYQIALADICIETGRFHQIRAQMAHAGLPLLGDLKYGDEEAKEKSRALGIQNVALCAYSLEFAHPVSGNEMKFRIEPKGRAFSLCTGARNVNCCFAARAPRGE